MINKRFFVFLALLISAAVSVVVVTACSSAPDAGSDDNDFLVGVYYFSGWWEDRHQANGWFKNLRDWRLTYPERIPLLGTENSQETIDREVIAASDHGVDFFQFLMYPLFNPDILEIQRQRVNEGYNFFMSSPENHRMRFSVDFCNHAPFTVPDEDSWKLACEELVAVMQHPAYLRVGGKAVLKIYNIRQLITDAGGMRQAVSWIQYLRELAREAGAGELLIGAGSQAGDIFDGVQALLKEFDYIQFYMNIPNMEHREKDYNYKFLIRDALGIAERRLQTPLLPYVPYIPAGWNPRPWAPTNNIYFSLPVRREWNRALSDMKKMVEQHNVLRLPDGTENGQKMVIIYCWNEYGEGGIVSPTQGDRYMKLEEIKRVFKR